MGVFFLSMDLGRSFRGGVFFVNGPRSFLYVLIMRAFFLSMDLGRSYHGNVFFYQWRSFLSWECFFLSTDLSVFSINGPRSFLSWECLFLSMQFVLIMRVFCVSMGLGRSYPGCVFSFNGPRGCFLYQWT